ncbi:terminase large subunit domain-containing protein [Holospora undulata]|uniref:Terminase large subunit gp17-like C-terminal domain-containing protein n=1 Tax=Holospora undulata HU1 TaxID=1321371 RepID=A0A061JIP2_9PROT|nr:terminase family protein [Holospora undulata]ETZ05498.1 hypothetical protein K737_300063 [Holospora undulata HU1]
MANFEDLNRILKRTLDSRTASSWDRLARPSQKEPFGDWRIWLILAGRGFGKTRTGAETIRKWAIKTGYRHICLLGNTFQDVQKVMVEGPSGLHSISRPEDGLIYLPHKKRVVWGNGAKADFFSATSFYQLRGPQFDSAWIDELGKFSNPEEVFHQLMLGLRLGKHPRVIITTTPRPCAFLHKLLNRSDVVLTRGATFENAKNLSPSYIDDIKQTYEGTRLGAQEIYGTLIEQNEQALWSQKNILYCSKIPPLSKCFVALDPAVTHNKTSGESGIIVVGKDAQGVGYVLQDYSGIFSPTKMISTAVHAMQTHKAQAIVAEVNNGGDFIQELLHISYPNRRFIPVRANKSKYCRAQPIAALYEQKRIYHVRCFPELEEQMMRYTPKDTVSPDRLDALVWGIHLLFFSLQGDPKTPRIWTI